MTAFRFDARAVHASVLAERRSTPATGAIPATDQGKITSSVAESQVSQTLSAQTQGQTGKVSQLSQSSRNELRSANLMAV